MITLRQRHTQSHAGEKNYFCTTERPQCRPAVQTNGALVAEDRTPLGLVQFAGDRLLVNVCFCLTSDQIDQIKILAFQNE